MRNSRWSRTGRKDKNGKLKHATFDHPDLKICKLLSPVRMPWGYQYMPTSYFHLLLKRGKSMKRRLNELVDEPGCYIKIPTQYQKNSRDLIYALADAGADELRQVGLFVPRIHLRELPHELMSCLIAASFEYGARIHNIPITPQEWPDSSTRPDWIPFKIDDTLVILEADMATETIYTKEQATSISGKYLKYLPLTKDRSIIKHFKVNNFIILFHTLRDARLHSMIEKERGLKRVITENDYDHDFAGHFGFTNINTPIIEEIKKLKNKKKLTDTEEEDIQEIKGFDHYINHIPPLTDWAVSQNYERAGFEPFNFLKK
jgi:hypothetical protein